MALTFNPTGGAYNGVKPLKEDSTIVKLGTMEDVARYDQKDVIGKFYPVKYLPALYVDQQSQAPVVMSAGDVVAAVPIGSSALLADITLAPTGIDANGNMYVTIGVNGNKYQKPYTYLYDTDTVGLLVPCNGTTGASDLSYGSIDGDAGVLTTSGTVPTSNDKYRIVAGTKPLGVLLHRAFGDIRERFHMYNPVNPAISVCTKGYFTLPFISIAYNSNDQATANAVAAFLADVSRYHQFVYAPQAHDLTSGDDLNVLAPGASLQVDGRGKFVIKSGNVNFGKIIALRSQAVKDLDEITDTFPGSKIQGTATAGLSTRLFDFGYRALADLTSVAPTPANVKSSFFSVVNLASGLTGRIVYGLVDVAFGY